MEWERRCLTNTARETDDHSESPEDSCKSVYLNENTDIPAGKVSLEAYSV